MKTVYAFLANGLEEVEALMVIDLLRRTHKLDVVMVSITDDLLVEGSHGIKIYADQTIDQIDFDKGDAIFLPGGIFSANLESAITTSASLTAFVTSCVNSPSPATAMTISRIIRA